MPVASDIFEISRGCLSVRLRAQRRRLVRNALTTAAVEYALMGGIRCFTCIADSGWLSQVLALGWDCWPLGLPQRVGRVMTGALRIDITPHTIRLLKDAGTYQHEPLGYADRVAEVAA